MNKTLIEASLMMLRLYTRSNRGSPISGESSSDANTTSKVWPQSKFSEEREPVTDVLLYIYVLVVLDNGQTWPKDLKISFLNRFCRDKKTVTNSFFRDNS